MSVSKTLDTTPSIEEVISKQDFFIDLYKAQIDDRIVQSFKDNVLFFEGLGCNILYKRKYVKDNVCYYIDPQSIQHGTIGFEYKNKR